MIHRAMFKFEAASGNSSRTTMPTYICIHTSTYTTILTQATASYVQTMHDVSNLPPSSTMTIANVLLLLVIDIGVFKDVIHLALLFVGIDLDSPGVARDVSFFLGATGLQVVDFSCETYVSIYAIIII